MRYKENQKKIFDEKFLELNMKTVTPDDLMNALEDGKVIIAVKSFEENTCEVRSYAVMNDEMVVYAPYHVLEIIKGFGCQNECIRKNDIIEWRNAFSDKDACIGIDDELLEPLGESKDTLYKDVFSHLTKLYITDDKPNFYGPLECEFMELWLTLNENYYIESVTED